MVIIFIVSWVICFIGNYMILKSTAPKVKPVEGEAEVVPQPPKTIDDLQLTSSLVPLSERQGFGLMGEAGEKEEAQSTEKVKQQVSESVRVIVDSMVAVKTDPLANQVTELDKELKNAQDQVIQLEELLVLVSGESDSIDQVQAKKLSKMLEGMKPKQAAVILTRLESKTNAKLLLMMNQKNAAKILSELPEENAAAIAKYLSDGFAKSSI